MHFWDASDYNELKETEMIKFIVGILSGVVAIIFILQNVQVIEVNFLGWSVSLSQSILFVILLVVGFALGWGTGSFRRRRRK